MPLYEYQCAKCRKKSEFIQNYSDPRETKCPHCGGPLKKLLSSPAVQFKGSGFYATDYAKPGSREESRGEKSEKSEEKKDSSKGEEGKPGGSESGAASAAEGKRDKDGDSSKGKAKEGGESAAGSSTPAEKTAPAPSKKKKDRTK